uniref:Uncharacterized protein n=1 Tax=Ditylenchus dipsaci TaxID=166011 RepID=A0A915E1M4_9BILA
MSFEDSFLASTFGSANDSLRFSREKDLNENYRRVQLQESLDEREAQLDLNLDFQQNRQRLLKRTQMNTAIPGSSSLVDLEDLTDDTDLSELEAELESLGILVKRIDGEKIFYTGKSFKYYYICCAN